MEGKYHLAQQEANINNTNDVLARVLVTLITKLNEKVQEDKTTVRHSFITTYSLVKEIKKFGNKGKQAAKKEIGQLHNCKCWKPIHKDKLTPEEKRKHTNPLYS